ncbi:MAG: Cytochrome c heme lyase subunit CcmL [Acidobacteria bacterium]|nr:Cytochrome c heme lyase subunit CcmL [Acidobacteriota bacterium]
MIALLLVLTLQTTKVPDAAQFVGAPQSTPLQGSQLDTRTIEIAGQLRCPVCQGLSVGDSPSAMAMNMKEQVRELLARGYTREQILAYFEQSYGEFVLLKPKFRGVDSLVWLLPLIALAIGGALVVMKMRKLERPVATTPSDAGDEYVNRVRQLVEKE